MNRFGYVPLGENAVATYEIVAKEPATDMEELLHGNNVVFNNRRLALGDYTVAVHGLYNMLPNEVSYFIRNNYLLPELMKKQVRYLYGRGLYLYSESIEDGKLKTVPLGKVEHKNVWVWLDSWKTNGGSQSVDEYVKSIIYEYYYMEEFYSKYTLNRARRINYPMPVRYLESVSGIRCRLASSMQIPASEDIQPEQIDTVIVGQWDMMMRKNMIAYPLFNYANPLANGTAISHVTDLGFDEEIYSTPTYYYGLKEWIKGENLNPKYINSYLKNSLNAKVHILIPDAWIQSKKSELEQICEDNRSREQAGKELITSYDGLTDIGTVFSFGLLQKLIDIKIKQATDVLSGEGKNQGKCFVSRKFVGERGIEEWEFKEIPVKYKEFVESITEYHNVATKAILAGKGLDPSISNVSNEGIFNNSGSQVYYNYLVYLESLKFPEEIVLKDLNFALLMNFPELADKNIKLGLYHNKPTRQEEVSPTNRLDQQ